LRSRRRPGTADAQGMGAISSLNGLQSHSGTRHPSRLWPTWAHL